jgi:hypothetical protein
MEYPFSKHVEIRLKERNIPKHIIETILEPRYPKVVVPSTKDPDVDLILAMVDNHGFVIIVNRVSCMIITVRKMRDREKTFYTEFIKHG